MRFEWRFTRSTGLLIVLIAAMLATAAIVTKPATQSDGSQVEAAVRPCHPHAWRYRWHTDTDEGFGYYLQQHYKIKYNGCNVKIVAGTHTCLHQAWAFIIGTDDCSALRLTVNNYRYPYSETLVVRAAFEMYPFSGLGLLHWPHFMCAKYNRNGVLWDFQRGPGAGGYCFYE